MAGPWEDYAPQKQAAPEAAPWLDYATPNTGEDVAKSVVSGAARGAIGFATAPRDIGDILGAGAIYAINRGMRAVGVNAPDDSFSQIREKIKQNNVGLIPTSEQVQKNIEGVTGNFYEPKTIAGKYASSIGEFTPSALAGGGGLVSRMVRGAILPGAASEAAGQAAEGTAFEPYARIGGAMAGAAAPALASRAATPVRIPDERKAALGVLEREGINVTAGQATGNVPIRYAESVSSDLPFGGGKAAAIDETQRRQFTSAVLKRIGSDADLATPEALRAAKSNISRNFDDLSSRNTLTLDKQLGSDLAKARSEYDAVLPSQQRAVADKFLSDIMSVGPSMSGQMYQDTRSRLTKMAETLKNSDPALADTFRGYKRAIDDAMARSISPEDSALWADARQKWGNWKVVERAATGAGENAAQGYISPAALRSAAANSNRAGYAVGRGDFSELARAGESILKPLPNSGTAQRQAAIGLLSGGVVGATGASPLGVAALAAAPIMSRVLMSDAMQAYLKNQKFGRAPSMTGVQRLGLLQASLPEEMK